MITASQSQPQGPHPALRLRNIRDDNFTFVGNSPIDDLMGVMEPTAWTLYLYLGRIACGEMQVTVKFRELSQRLRMSQRPLQKAIHDLETYGLISRVVIPAVPGRSAAITTYCLIEYRSCKSEDIVESRITVDAEGVRESRTTGDSQAIRDSRTPVETRITDDSQAVRDRRTTGKPHPKQYAPPCSDHSPHKDKYNTDIRQHSTPHTPQGDSTGPAAPGRGEKMVALFSPEPTPASAETVPAEMIASASLQPIQVPPQPAMSDSALDRDAPATEGSPLQYRGYALPKPKIGAKLRPDVIRAFEHWCVTHHRRDARLNADRYYRLENAISQYGAQDILDAISGIALSPFHMGDNDSGKVYDEVGVICKNSDNIEKFRDYHRGLRKPEPWRNRPGSKRADQMVEEIASAGGFARRSTPEIPKATAIPALAAPIRATSPLLAAFPSRTAGGAG